ncbi:MAG TPA: WYL domain-containing protein, partial [Treponema sp.]|nr:WYL domain-containing protein [Treponema sp.]HRS05155.1 WYL domain-containing protein [Treponema sp.]
PFTARVQFCEEQAPYIKELAWPEGSSLEDQKDGSLILTVRTAGAYELKRWVMSFGSAAQLLEPDYLRNEIIEELKASLETYSNYKGNETR